MHPRLLPVLLASVLFLAACGGDDDGGTAFVPDDDAPATDADATGSDDSASPTDDGTDDTAPAPTGEDRSGELVGTWTVAFYALPDGGGMTNVVEGSAPVSITFNADGTIDYHTGCNSGSATYTTAGTYYVRSSALDDVPEGQAISILPGGQTEIGCEGFLGEQDLDLPAAWEQAERFWLAENRLVLAAEFFLVEAQPS